MFKLIGIAFLMILSGCGKFYSKGITYVEEDFSSYYEEFLNEADLRSVSIPYYSTIIKFDPYVDTLSSGAITVDGLCNWQPSNKSYEREILINPISWAYKNHFEREFLIFHELGHCLLGLQHNNQRITIDGQDIPASLMAKFMINSSVYSRHREYYLTQLFNATRVHAFSSKTSISSETMEIEPCGHKH